MRRTLTIVAVAGAALIMAMSPATSAPRTSASRPAAVVGRLLPKDFNFDALDDLAIGAPGEDVGAIADAGAVTVVYGKDRLPSQTFRQGAGGVAGGAERGDRFGAAVARGYFNDFNEDGLADLAVGVPGEDVGGVVDAGAVNILYGSAAGLTGGPLLSESPPRAGAHFGAALATGDFNGDRRGDLVVAAPDEAVGSAAGAGQVTVIYGSGDAGVAAGGRVKLRQGAGGVPGQAEPGDHFGAALASGILDTDSGYSDLAIGVPGEDVGATANAGAVNPLAGSAAGLRAGPLLLQGHPEPGDRFGAALSMAFYKASYNPDLAVGAPGETVGGKVGAGAVSVFSGSARTLGRERLLYERADPWGVAAGDAFGAALGWSGVLFSDQIAGNSLIVGIPGRDRFGSEAGAIYGCGYVSSGVPAGLECIMYTLQGNGAGAEPGDRFGAAVTGGYFGLSPLGWHNYDGDGYLDLAVGAPGETVNGQRAAGAVSILYGCCPGPYVIERLIYQGHDGVGGVSEAGDDFGAALA
ncbi:MAG TPA: hypothetical protein VGC06_25330 [Actinomycetes bacterium]